MSETQKPEGMCSCNGVRVKKETKQKKPFPCFMVNCETEFKDCCYLLLDGISVSHYLEPTRR